MASPSIRELEARILADRRALTDNRRRLRVAVERRLSSPTTLLGGFLAGVAGGWVAKGPSRDKQVRRLERELQRAREESGGEAPPASKSRLLSLLSMLSMGLRLAAALRGSAQDDGARAQELGAGGNPE